MYWYQCRWSLDSSPGWPMAAARKQLLVCNIFENQFSYSIFLGTSRGSGLRFFRSLRGPCCNDDDDASLVSGAGDRKSFLTSLSLCATRGGNTEVDLPNPTFVDLSLGSLIQFEDEGFGHKIAQPNVAVQRRKRPNYNNTSRRLMARMIEREKHLGTCWTLELFSSFLSLNFIFCLGNLTVVSHWCW